MFTYQISSNFKYVWPLQFIIIIFRGRGGSSKAKGVQIYVWYIIVHKNFEGGVYFKPLFE